MTSCRFIIPGMMLLAVLYAPCHLKASETMSVQVKESPVRATASFLGKIVANVVYGDRVTVEGKSASWTKVSLQGGAQQGWIHSSALTTKRIILKSGQANVQTGTSQDELALAGKGFNDQVEASFMNQNKKLDYTWINRMEAFKVDTEAMNRFLADGGVAASGEGGAQ